MIKRLLRRFFPRPFTAHEVMEEAYWIVSFYQGIKGNASFGWQDSVCGCGLASTEYRDFHVCPRCEAFRAELG